MKLVDTGADVELPPGEPEPGLGSVEELAPGFPEPQPIVTSPNAKMLTRNNFLIGSPLRDTRAKSRHTSGCEQETPNLPRGDPVERGQEKPEIVIVGGMLSDVLSHVAKRCTSVYPKGTGPGRVGRD